MKTVLAGVSSGSRNVKAADRTNSRQNSPATPHKIRLQRGLSAFMSWSRESMNVMCRLRKSLAV